SFSDDDVLKAMRLSRRDLIHQLGAGTAAAVAAPALGHAAPPTARRRPSPIRLSANESAYGPSPNAIAAIREIDGGAAGRYPDVELDALRRSIARRHSVDPDRVVLGAGSGEILRAAADAFLGPARTLVLAHPTCQTIRRHAIRKGSAVAAVPLA